MPNPLPSVPDASPDPAAEVTVGAGRTAEVVDRGDGTVVKWFLAGTPRSRVDDEASRSTAAAAVVGDLVGVPEVLGILDGAAGTARAVGIVFDKVEGPEMMKVLASRPWRVASEAARLAVLQTAIVTRRTDRLPELHEALRTRIERAPLMRAQRSTALASLEVLPRSDHVCHGDLHPGNVLLGPQGAAVIDWANATRGEPAADLAQTWMLLTTAAIPDEAPARPLLVAARRVYCAAWWSHVRRAAPLAASNVDRWRALVVAARLGDCPAGEEPALQALLRRLGRGEHRGGVRP